MLYAVVTYANMRGVRAVDRIVELCERDLAFIWLTKGQKPKRDAFYDFKSKKLTGEVLDELNYQFLRRLKREGLANIQSEKGILKRQIRSIQTEGHFGDIKENENFRRFNYRSSEKVYKEFMLYAMGRNINKYHRFLHHEIEKFTGKAGQKTA